MNRCIGAGKKSKGGCMKNLSWIMIAFLGVLAACTSEAPKPAEKPQPKPPEYVTGRAGFYKVYAAARAWNRDVQGFKVESTPTADAHGQDGKAAVWRTGYASPTGRGVKTFTWSGIERPKDSDLPERGISSTVEDNYNPSNSSTAVFDSNFFKIDTDAAYETAQKHGGEKLVQKTPDINVQYLLDWSRPESKLIWHVMYGGGRDDAKLKVDVDATTGEFIRLEK
jgi:hypothetical protein